MARLCSESGRAIGKIAVKSAPAMHMDVQVPQVQDAHERPMHMDVQVPQVQDAHERPMHMDVQVPRVHGDGMDAGGRATQEQLPDAHERPALDPTYGCGAAFVGSAPSALDPTYGSQAMRVIDTTLPGVKLIEPDVFGDARGQFFESYHQVRYAAAGIDFTVTQSNVSRSAHGVLRGLHYQWPQPQGKLVGVLEGEVFDVAVDIRRGSPHFGQWTAAVLSADNHRQLWIPEGFAHGFVVTSTTAVFHYLCSAPYDRTADASLCWNDAELAINWPIPDPELSDKDARAPFLAEIAPDRLPDYPA